MKPTIGQTVYYLSSTETYRQVYRGVVEAVRTHGGGGVWVSDSFLPRATTEIYATEDEAKAARLAYYESEAEAAARAYDRARARLSNAVAWRERAASEMGEKGGGE